MGASENKEKNGLKPPGNSISNNDKRLEQVAEFISQKLIRAHKGIVRDITTLDNKYFITCGDDYKISVYEGDSKTRVMSLEGHKDRVNRLLIVKNKKRRLLLSASYDQTVKIWSVKTFKLLRTLYTTGLVIDAIDWINEHSLLLLGNQAGKLSLIGIGNLKEICTLNLKAQIWSLANDGSLKKVFAGTGDGRILTIDFYERKVVHTLFPEQSLKIVHKLLVAHTFNKALLLVARQGRFHVFDLDDDYKELCNILVSNQSIRGLSFDEENKKAFISCCDCSLKMITFTCDDGKFSFQQSERITKHNTLQSVKWWPERKKLVNGDWLGYISIIKSVDFR